MLHINRSKIEIARILWIWVQERSLRSRFQKSLLGVYKIFYLEVKKIIAVRVGDLQTALLGRGKETSGLSWPSKKPRHLGHLSALIINGNTRFQQYLVGQGFSTIDI